MKKLNSELKTTFIFATHDDKVISYLKRKISLLDGKVDIDEIITGKPLFGLDYKEEGMVYASVLRPPAFGQVLESFDDSAARQVSGVLDVITIGDKARKYLNQTEFNPAYHWTVQLSESDKVVVIANSTWAALKGQKALNANWENKTQVESTDYHSHELDKVINGDDFNTLREEGSVKQAFIDADDILERTY